MLGPGCGSASSVRSPAGAARTILILVGVPDDARVRVDDEDVGTVGRLGGVFALRAGSRRLEIDAPGFFPHRAEIELEPGREYTYELELWPCFPELDVTCEDATQRSPNPLQLEVLRAR